DYDGNQLVLGDIIPADDDFVEETVDKPSEKQLIDSLIAKLGRREREIMVLRYGLEGQDELTQREVAIKLGISQSYISRLEKRILGDMKEKLMKEFQA
ncbi:MAG: sigma-70 family RNA polymerase sigma factor, partial [Clostridia bacterium]|nr:sigma-70 family RNA polymerase sigma factor [Clostridia bacterium]